MSGSGSVWMHGLHGILGNHGVSFPRSCIDHCGIHGRHGVYGIDGVYGSHGIQGSHGAHGLYGCVSWGRPTMAHCHGNGFFSKSSSKIVFSPNRLVQTIFPNRLSKSASPMQSNESMESMKSMECQVARQVLDQPSGQASGQLFGQACWLTNQTWQSMFGSNLCVWPLALMENHVIHEIHGI